MVTDTLATEVNGEIRGVPATARKREVASEGLPFLLIETLMIVPATLVKKILKGEFVELAELLIFDAKQRESGVPQR